MAKLAERVVLVEQPVDIAFNAFINIFPMKGYFNLTLKDYDKNARIANIRDRHNPMFVMTAYVCIMPI